MDSDLRSLIRTIQLLSPEEKNTIFHNLGFRLLFLDDQEKLLKLSQELSDKLSDTYHHVDAIQPLRSQCDFCFKEANYFSAKRQKYLIKHKKNCLGVRIVAALKRV